MKRILHARLLAQTLRRLDLLAKDVGTCRLVVWHLVVGIVVLLKLGLVAVCCSRMKGNFCAHLRNRMQENLLCGNKRTSLERIVDAANARKAALLLQVREHHVHRALQSLETCLALLACQRRFCWVGVQLAKAARQRHRLDRRRRAQTRTAFLFLTRSAALAFDGRTLLRSGIRRHQNVGLCT